jgi:hypothetical protein
VWWLCYQRNGQPFAVVIVEGASLIAARMHASLSELGRGGVFSGGHALDAQCSALLTPNDINRTLSLQEAEALIDRFERGAEKKPPAPSVKRGARARAKSV